MPPKLVIFDCDGVLVDSEPVTNRVLAENLTRHGFPVTVDDCLDLFVGGTMSGVGDEVRARGVDLPDNWLDDVYAEIYAALAAGTPIIAGIPQVLDRLDQAGIPFCVASNGSEEKMDITLGQNGLSPRFAGRRFSAHVLKVAKPDPGLFLAAADAFGAAPAECVVVEDSPSGVKAARAADICCFGYAAHDDGRQLAAHGARVFHDMADLPKLLEL